MDRRHTILALFALGAAPLVGGQPATKTARIGWLSPTSRADPASQYLDDAFRRGLSDLGWVEGRNIVTDIQYANGKMELFPELASEQVRRKVDVIVAVTFAAARAARDASNTIPIVMVAVGDPVGSGLIASLARPGGNITGRSFDVTPEINTKLLDMLKRLVPNLSRVAVLWNSASPFHHAYVKEIQRAGKALNVRLQSLPVQKPHELEGAFKDMARNRAAGLIVLSDALMSAHRKRIVSLAARNHLPAIYGNSLFMDTGGLMSYGANLAEIWRGAASYVDKILKGAKPGDLPVEQPSTFEFIINLGTARALKLTIPQDLLLQADRVIE
ncbi:MAG: ABC transporter substrate-binding protein [Betaproteobacteria bacterium]|nr:ABC transporter substrate-binding protein [Betaproteobacteria bacterium]